MRTAREVLEKLAAEGENMVQMSPEAVRAQSIGGGIAAVPVMAGMGALAGKVLKNRPGLGALIGGGAGAGLGVLGGILDQKRDRSVPEEINEQYFSGPGAAAGTGVGQVLGGPLGAATGFGLSQLVQRATSNPFLQGASIGLIPAGALAGLIGGTQAGAALGGMADE